MFAVRRLAARITARPASQVYAFSARPGLSALSRPAALQGTFYRRPASSSASPGAGSRVFNFFYGTTLILGLGIIYVYITDTRASIHRWVVIPALRWIYPDPEQAHEVGNRSLKQLWTFGLHPRERGNPDAKGDLAVNVFGHLLQNPIGTSAGIDKHAEIPDPLLAIGPAVVELGGTTPLPQKGNDKPRVFRLTSQNAMINRYGLNSEGADHVANQLRLRVRHFAEACGFGHDINAETKVLDGHAGVPPGSLTAGKLLAVNIAKNKTTPENDIEAVTKDYLYCAERLAPYVDILVVNVSSPNTPGLRSLQNQEALTKILTSVVRAARSVQRVTKPSVMVKVSPDEDSDEQVAGICQAIWEADVDGVIVGNTTNQRPKALTYLNQYTPLEQQHLLETGGFSGPHLFEKTLSMVKKYKELLGDMPPPDTIPSRSSGSVSKLVEKTKSSLSGPETKMDPNGDAATTSIRAGTLPATDYGAEASSTTSKQPELSRRDQPKVIFATGGITNGKQALEVLNAGASVAMVYTALVYGGVGTISRIKEEIRQEISQQKKKKKIKLVAK